MSGGVAMRRVWAGLLIAAWAGFVPAQQPAVRPTNGGDILIQKTAGQPERRLKLLKLDTGPDGERVADVQDLATGLRYTVPASALANMKRAAADPIYPGPTPFVTAPKPTATTGNSFPTSLPVPAPSPGGQSPFVSRPLPTTPEPRSRPPMIAVAPPPPVAPKPMPAAPPEPVTIVPVQPAPVVPLIPAAPVRPVAYQTPATWQTTRSDQMRAEIDPYVSDLVNALRPSVRERAATTLANCRHASHPEVKGLLARTAMSDPAPSVQAHCVGILSALGYHEREYVEFLEVSLGSDHAGLRQAAATALAKLTPR